MEFLGLVLRNLSMHLWLLYVIVGTFSIKVAMYQISLIEIAKAACDT